MKNNGHLFAQKTRSGRALSFALVLLFSTALSAQVVEIDNGTYFAETPPEKSNHDYSYTQQLYLKSEINTAGQITAIRFYYYGNNGVPASISNSNEWVIYMGHTTATDMLGGWLPTSSMTQVFSGTLPANPAVGWVNITLSTPFTYNNINNLVIAVDENKPGNNGMDEDWIGNPTSTARQRQAYGTTNINPASPPTPNIIFNGVPIVQLVFGTPPPCVPNPTSPADFSSLCGPQAVTLSWPAAPGATSYTVLLDDDPALTSADIVGTVSSPSFTTSTLGVATWYWAIIPTNSSGQANGCFIWEFDINAIPTGNTFADPIIISSLPYAHSSNNITSLTCYTDNFGQPSPDIFYRFTTTACQSRVDISLCGGLFVFDNYLHLLNSSGTTIATNNDDGPLCSGWGASLRMDNLPAGTYYIVVEGNGNAVGPYTLNVSASDITPPVPTCPANISQPNTTGICGRVVTFANATATDNCPGTPTITQIAGPASGSTFPVGATAVTFRATDGSSNSSTCSFTVTINDTQTPSISCPANITQPNTTGTCAANVSFSAATATDNCTASPTIAQIGGPASGSSFAVGTSTITYRATDGSSNSSTCSFTVTVNDTQTPSISCPANITQPATAGGCTANVSFSAATATDNCTASPTITQIAGPASGSPFSVGATTVTYRATDASSNSSTCTFTVTITDTQAPSISCPTTQTLAVGASCQASLPNYTSLGTASDNCTASPAKTQSPSTGTNLALGSSIITLTATDGGGLTSSCTFSVQVVDQTAPSISCPASIIQPNTAGTCAANVSFSAATATDNCTASPAIAQIGGPASGSSFPVGSTTITYRATDGSSNSSTCSFTVTVNDIQTPSISCPANITQPATAGGCTANVSFAAATATDNCTASPTITQIGGPASGSSFSVGATTITYRATDASSNSSTCTFTVTITDTQAPSISCPATQTLVVGASCQASLPNYTSLGTASDNCTASPAKTQSPSTGTNVTIGSSIVTLTATDGGGLTSTCTFSVQVVDQTVPSISCPANITQGNTPGQCAANVSFAAATATDNCTASPTITQIGGPASGSSFAVGSTTITYRATDGSSNSSTCSFTVTVNDTQTPLISCPANIVQSAASGCSANVSFAAATATDNCTASPTITQIGGPASGSSFSVGTTTITYRATDGSSNSSTCTFTVTVNDSQAPSISCPANIVQPAATGQCAATVSFAAATATDNCTASPTIVQIAGPASGSSFSVGTSTITYRATDGSSNSSTCTFTVTVNDTQPPSIFCPGQQTQTVNANCQAPLADYSGLGGSSDNCTVSPVKSQSPVPNTMMPLGASIITLKATDPSGLFSTCTFTLQVVDQTAPGITCPANIAQGNTPGQCAANVSFAAATATDNCTASPTVTQIGGPASGSSFAVGAPTTITYRATDGSSNSSTCTFTVTVNDTQVPSIVCPANISQANIPGQCAANVSFAAATATDNCTASPGIVQTGGPASGSSFPVGNTTVTYRATDAASNSSTCSFTVTVNDTQVPTISCPANISQVNSTNQCGANVSFASATAADNCSASLVVTNLGAASGSFFAVGTTSVTFRATDGSGNSSTCSFMVTVNDTQAPSISCPANIIANNSPANACSATVTYATPGATDNCAIASTILVGGMASGSSFPVGTTTNTWRTTDVNGNSSTCSFTVQVRDVTLPLIVCPANQNVTAGATCMGIVGAWAPTSLTDNCSPAPTFVQSPAASTTLAGHNDSEVVTLTATDASGNTASCSFTVTLKDLTPPVAKCKNATINLGTNGSVTVQSASINNGSTDNCAFSLAVLPNTFGCNNLGVNTVTLKATDAGGNTSTCTAVVTIKDLTPPTALCKTINVYLDASGQASITPAAVNNNSYDACGIATMSISINTFDCSQINASPVSVQLTLKDVNNNTSSCLAQVYVKDALAPTAVCDNTSVSLGASGYVSVATAPLASNSTDNCSVWSYSPVAKVYTTANLGVNNLTITVKDWSGNSATCVSQVTVYPYGSNLPGPDQPEEMAAVDQEVSEALGGPLSLDLSVTPNPTLGESTLQFRLEKDQPYRLRLFDLGGRLIMDTSFEGFAGDNSLQLELSELDAGMYLIDVQTVGWHGQKKLILQRS